MLTLIPIQRGIRHFTMRSTTGSSSMASSSAKRMGTMTACPARRAYTKTTRPIIVMLNFM